jgi:hypothetical protein
LTRGLGRNQRLHIRQGRLRGRILDIAFSFDAIRENDSTTLYRQSKINTDRFDGTVNKKNYMEAFLKMKNYMGIKSRNIINLTTYLANT